jgi:peptide/nickel transport system ATP-binding protein
LPPLLSIKNLSIGFNQDGEKTTAVVNSSFDVNEGEIVAIVGESGSGKSITALSLLQLLPKHTSVSGQILFSEADNETIDLLQLPEKQIIKIRGSKIGMIFQEPMTSLNPVHTCGQQVMEALQLHKKINKKIALQQTIDLFEKVKLPNAASMVDRYPHQISGGQKQRVMIAMAMCCNPALLIADEPTTALDVTVQKTILQLIKELQQQQNMGVILITHDLGIVADVADKIVVMYKGAIVEQGDTKIVLQTPQHNYTKALLACRPSIHPKGKRLPIVSDFIGEKNETSTPLSNKEIVIQKLDDTKVLSVENLKVYFSAPKKLFEKQHFFKAVDDVSFTVNKGEVLGLVGESGCGKTTLGRAILQLVKPTAGKIILNQKDITTLSPATIRSIRKDLQIVFQDPYGSLNPRLTIGNAILEPLRVHQLLHNDADRKEKVMELLQKVSLNKDQFNKYPHQFSGGQRQRICIARALALNPSFLIFDESVSALDVSVQAQILNLINGLKNEMGFTAIFISHDLSVVKYISDRILVMHQGKIIEQGEAEQIYNHPQQAYTQQLIAAIPGKQLSY